MTIPSGLTGAALEALLQVQDLDTALDQHRHRRAALPERAELASLHDQVAGLNERLTVACVARDEVAGRQRALEDSLAATEARAAEISKRLYGGTVSATRELQAMATEVDVLNGRASDLESRVLELMEGREPLDADVAGIEGQKASLLRAAVALGAVLAEREAVIDAEVDDLSGQRAAASAQVPDDLLATYARLRQRLGGVGAARLVGSLCQGCHISLAASELDQIRRQPPGALIFCEQCGRILVPTQPSS